MQHFHTWIVSLIMRWHDTDGWFRELICTDCDAITVDSVA